MLMSHSLSWPLSLCALVWFCLLFVGTIILSLIPVYLPDAGPNIVNINNKILTLFKATYATNIINGNALFSTDPSLLVNSLAQQLHLSKSITMNLITSQFIASSSGGRKKRATCDGDASGFAGDYYSIETQINDPTQCRTEYCSKKSASEIATSAYLYPSLTLPFKSSNGEVVFVSMVLCKFGEFFPVSPSCFDNIQNLDETDVDCGGTTCSSRCNEAQKCISTSDCNDATTCVMGICLGEASKILAACQRIKNSMSSGSQVLYQSDAGYSESISHYAVSSTAFSVCSVEPDLVVDVTIVLGIIGEMQIPFAIKGGGHSMNPGFSSTTAILIVMSHFDQVIYDKNSQSVNIGSGLTWDAVYKVLDPQSVTVIGGRVADVGVAGFTLGGGYSWKSNQYGLCVDNVAEFELVTPNAAVVYVNSVSYPDIFFGLKGGFNNFGIVTSFTMNAVPQTNVYGGILYYSPLTIEQVIQAAVNFQTNNKDPKAQLIGSFIIAPGQYLLSFILFYDAPALPAGIYDEFLNIPHGGALQTQSYNSFVKSIPANENSNLRGRFSSVSVTMLSSNLLHAINNQLLYSNSTVGSKLGAILIFNIQSFTSNYLDRSEGGAYPHVASTTPLMPIDIEFSWALTSDDSAFIDELKRATNAVLQAAVNDGQDVGGSKQIIYPNYALEDTPLTNMYGDNLPRLQSIRKAWDPQNIMYLTGGFKF